MTDQFEFKTPPRRRISIGAKAIAYRDREIIRTLGRDLVGEARRTGLPGRINGPQDVYRHLTFAGELTLRYGSAMADQILEINEMKEYSGGIRYGVNTDIGTTMDRTVNPMAIKAMRGVKTPQDVRRVARALTIESVRNNGSGANGSIPYLPEHLWTSDPRPDGGDRNAIPPDWRPRGLWPGNAGINPRLADMALEVPVEQWTEAHLRAVMQDRRYFREHRERQARTARVARYLEAKHGGPIQVGAYTRSDGTPVAAHTRASVRA
jgi:hypothetical protein